MSKATRIWDEWYPQFIAKHKQLGELEPTLSYSCGQWSASITIRQGEPYERDWLEDIGVIGCGSTPLEAVQTCIAVGNAYVPPKPQRDRYDPSTSEWGKVLNETVRQYVNARLNQQAKAGKILAGLLQQRKYPKMGAKK